MNNFPVKVAISFKKIIQEYEKQLEVETSAISRKYIKDILDYVKSFPKLIEGIESMEELEKHREGIKVLLADLFPNILTTNEIKTASVPFYNNLLFNSTKRFAKIMEDAGKDFKLEPRNFDEDLMYVRACVIILNKYYNYKFDFSRPLIYDIPDKDGIMKHYRLAMNSDFVEIEPTEKAKEITPQDVDILLQDPDNIEIWKEKFPPQSWIFKGFTLLNFTDVTTDSAISDLKSALMGRNNTKGSGIEDLNGILRTIYKIQDLRIGFLLYNPKKDTFRVPPIKGIESFLVKNKTRIRANKLFDKKAYECIVKNHNYFPIANVENYVKKTNNNALCKSLKSNGMESCIIVPIANNNELLGIMELVSKNKNELNSINATKLEDFLPYIATAVERNRNDYENQVKAVIQNECTSIHPSVLWAFEEEAKRYIDDLGEDGIASFQDIAFKDVYPLYGQIDIVGSTKARNEAIQKDLLSQLQAVKEIIGEAEKREALPIYEQLRFRLDEFIEELDQNLDAASEQKVFNLLNREINPVLDHIRKQSPELKQKVEEHEKNLQDETGTFCNSRKVYDVAIQNINRTMSRYIDRKQIEAQKMYPHYFERYKTDGVDHNIYIGASMTNKPFDKIYLYNMRLWQLQVMCEMENKFYQIQEDWDISLDAASLILVYSNTLSIRYRMDEKKFDIDGAYNARYEVIKKRLDKALVKGTEERLTQKGKIVIIYTQKSDEREYLRYIKYLQKKKYLGKNVEILELEEVQGVIGLKALRVEVLYHKEDRRESFSYEDLMQELH